MTGRELANLVGKPLGTVSMFFSRHNLSVRSLDDVRFYLDYIHKGKRIEQGNRTTAHLKNYQFKAKNISLQRARELISARHLMWYGDIDSLSLESIVEHVMMYGDYEDFQELERIVGAGNIKNVFKKQISSVRTNYRQQTVHFFKYYFNLI